MTKISFDVDFSKDPEKILQEIQERAKAEVENAKTKKEILHFFPNCTKPLMKKLVLITKVSAI